MADLITEALERWTSGEIRELLADVWDDGYGDGCCEHGNNCDPHVIRTNPYRQETE